MTAERWLPIPGYGDRYEVSDLGRVRSLWHRGLRRPVPLVLSPKLAKGYRNVALCAPGAGPKYYYVHRLVLLAFVGPPPAGYEGAHLDGCPLNNRLSNLKWATAVENNSHKLAHGTHGRGEQSPTAVLTTSQVIDARNRARAGEMIDDIAASFGVHRTTIRAAVTGKNWRHVPGAVPSHKLSSATA